MRRHCRSTSLPLAALCALALAAPAAAAAAEEAATTPTTTTAAPAETTATAPPEATATTPAPASTAPEPAPAPAGEPQTATAPQVQAQHAQGVSPSSPAAGAPPARHGAKAKAKPGSAAAGAQAGKRAPSPSALTPALPLAFGSPIAGVPAFFIESFRIPPFLLPIYQAAGTAYGIPWQVLAAINEVETDYGRDLSVSSAGAEGWMQFLPASWATYGVDANGDGFRDPYNPADAIFAAARYLRAAGGDHDLRGAIFAYNHSQAYVQSVLLRARLLGGTPAELVGAITGLTQARFPVHAAAHFADGFPNAPAAAGSTGAAAKTIPGTTIYAQAGAPVIAVQDGIIVRIGRSQQLGRYVTLRDAYGNAYTYAQLGSVAALYPVLEPHEAGSSAAHATRHAQAAEPRPSAPASAGVQPRLSLPDGEGAAIGALPLGGAGGLQSATPPAGGSPSTSPAPSTPPAQAPAQPPAPGAVGNAATPRVFRAGPNDVYLHPLRTGASVIAGTVLGHVGADTGPAAAGSEGEAHMLFQIRPAGAGAPLIDPKPILDGWVELENSSVFRAKGDHPFQAGGPSAGQVLLESKQQLQRQVLANPGISIYPCGRQDIRSGLVDRRVLATLEFLEVSGLRPTVSALRCGHTDTSGPESAAEHSGGDAVDIAAVNGTPIAGHQGRGSIADTTIRKLLSLQGPMRPRQIISLMRYPGADNTLAMGDHSDHVHVGFRPLGVAGARLAGLGSAITPAEWLALISRLGEIPNPRVASGPSPASIPDHPAASAPAGRPGNGNG